MYGNGDRPEVAFRFISVTNTTFVPTVVRS